MQLILGKGLLLLLELLYLHVSQVQEMRRHCVVCEKIIKKIDVTIPLEDKNDLN